MSEHPDSGPRREEVLFADDSKAQSQFEIYRSQDPFPEIAPALLNSADIYDYVATTGMISPFYGDRLKSASYEVGILGTVVYWDEKGKEFNFVLKKGETFVLRQNSIAFVTPEPFFRLPDYIALRFNLRINLVHRGLLLGTGPLVDPGFVGNLLIPLHNLTTNDYTFRGGDPLIWMEFTKLSPNKRWVEGGGKTDHHRSGSYVPFPNFKKKLEPSYYLHEAAGDRPIRSSIPDAVEDARRSAQEAEKKAKSIARNVTWTGVGSIVALVVALSFGLYQIASLILDSNSYVREAQEKLNVFQREFDHQKEPLESIKQMVQSLEREVQDLKKQVNALSTSLEDYKALRQEQTQKNAPAQ